MDIVRLYVCAEHVYVGHFGRPPGATPMIELKRARIEPGLGVVGDRYHEKAAGHKGQVTFFSEETWLRLREELGQPEKEPSVFRRNVIVRGADLAGLIGRPFELQGVRFEGSEYCKPCFWMDQAFALGTLQRLTEWKAGGLRARALSGGELVRD
ncbi:MAG: MOSC domain-containing protein, partial [Opitutaceae bacterium]